MSLAKMLDTALMAAQHVMRPAPPVPPPAAAPATPIALPDGNYTMTNPAAFFAAVRAITGSLDQVQVDTINRLLAGATRWRAPWLAYALATAWHECRLRPIAEWGKGRGRYYGKPGAYGGQVPYGRGLVQLTHDRNYEWADKALGLNGSLLRNFDRALEPDIAARILVLGMETGAFTGKALRHYLTGDNATREQFRQARRIINGMDKSDLIAGYAERFMSAIAKGGWRD
jgi:hypothetical protein